MRLVGRGSVTFGRKHFAVVAAGRMRKKPTKHEAILKSAMDAKWGNLFVHQYAFDGFIFDFYNRDLRLAIEVDGKSHTTARGFLEDAMKLEAAKKKKVRMFRVTNQQVEKDIEIVLGLIATEIGYRAGSMRDNKAAQEAALAVVNQMDERSGIWYRQDVDDESKLN